jgi:hypothetical protein
LHPHLSTGAACVWCQDRRLVDSTTLIVIASIAQTVVITLTLGVFIFQFRSQEKAIRESAYQNVQGRYTDYIRMLVEKPELAKLLRFNQDGDRSKGAAPADMSPEDQVISAYILLGYGIMEEVFTLYKKKWIDEETWQQWATFLKAYTTFPLFARVHEGTAGTFDRQFEEYVTKLMKEKD